VAEEISKYKLDLVGVQEVRWVRGDTEPAGQYISKLLDQAKQAKVQWLQDQSEINGDNLNNIRRETSMYFRNKKKEYMKDKKMDELATSSKNKSIIYLYRE
jgi:uncharacterized NAD(P)/FAD-binding protein YdhS